MFFITNQRLWQLLFELANFRNLYSGKSPMDDKNTMLHRWGRLSTEGRAPAELACLNPEL